MTYRLKLGEFKELKKWLSLSVTSAESCLDHSIFIFWLRFFMNIRKTLERLEDDFRQTSG